MKTPMDKCSTSVSSACQGLGRRDHKVQIEICFIDPDDADDPAVAGYRAVSHV